MELLPLAEVVGKAEAFIRGKDWSNAHAVLRVALERFPNNVYLRLIFAHVLREVGKPFMAIEEVRKALTLDPNNAQARNTLAHLLSQTGQVDKAVEEFRAAVQAAPSDLAIRGNLALELSKADRLFAAEAEFEDALRIGETSHLLFNYGAYLGQRHRFREAVRMYDRALAIEPDHVLANFNRAVTLLLEGRLGKGFEAYERRFEYFEFLGQKRPDWSLPDWKGESLAGKQILAYSEQGIGDLIQFVRWAKRLKERGAHVVLMCPRETVTLFDGYPHVDRIVVDEDEIPEGCDYKVSVMSLPHRFGVASVTDIDPEPYLEAGTPDFEFDWGQYADKLKVGICWAGRRGTRTDNVRSTHLYHFRSLQQRRPDMQLFSLQKDRGAERVWAGRRVKLDAGFDKLDLVDLAPLMTDFKRTAGLVQHLDLVITVDTSMAHLCGALGRPTWVLLPRTPDWRWMMDCRTSPYYKMMSLFRQSTPGDWAGVFGAVGRALAGDDEVPEFHPKGTTDAMLGLA